MLIERTEMLIKERDKVLTNIAEYKGNRAKWLIALMDIDDEMDELLSETEATKYLKERGTP